ncbi:Serine-threonine/tyrosine-protein kinase, catalytic domain [Dillenia turbinata]|uniref:non-specific serine/threonine protein kinase n=1 Tax=Dillenia turbinata TaxID=194707 RepID=A0AAN8ZQF4_9MAGN
MGNFCSRTNRVRAVNSTSSCADQAPRTEEEILQNASLKRFSFQELKKATRKFRADIVLGEGGFGKVYKGWIDEHSMAATKPGSRTTIAVKMLKQDSLQGHNEWLAEIKFLGHLHHPNLIKLIGFCFENEHRLLVYEFMPGGSLNNHVFRRDSRFGWSLRMKVCLDAAKGLAFLHNASPEVIHRNVGTSDILLDSNYNAKLSDFGLARYESHMSTRVMGTYGYAAPEYVATGHLSTKSDVYGFGVVLLEMLSGRRVIDRSRPSGEQNLVQWAKPYLSRKRKIVRVMDAQMEGQYSWDIALKVAKVTLKCLSPEPRTRPTMNEVVATLEQVQDSRIRLIDR